MGLGEGLLVRELAVCKLYGGLESQRAGRSAGRLAS